MSNQDADVRTIDGEEIVYKTVLDAIKAKIENQLFIGRIINSKDFDDGLRWCLEIIDEYLEENK